MKKGIIFTVLAIIIVSFATTFYFQHQAFTEQKTTMKSNFAKQQKKSDQQLKELQNKNSELEKTIKTNEEKTNALQNELDSVKAGKEQTVATNQDTAETPIEQKNDAVTPATQQEEAVAPVVETPKEKTNASNQTVEERSSELQSKVDSGEITQKEKLDILLSEFP